MASEHPMSAPRPMLPARALGRLMGCMLLYAAGSAAVAQKPAAEFTFLVGPYPSRGLLEYRLDCRTYGSARPDATAWTLFVDRDGQAVIRERHVLAADRRAHGYLHVGRMPDGARYTVVAALTDRSGKELARQTDTFTRHIMPFETADPVGARDIVVPPFTPPVVGRSAVSCWGRTYRHGARGLVEQITAAGGPLLSRPAAFLVRGNGHALSALRGSPPKLSAVGRGAARYDQTFTGQGVSLKVHGDFDYDGFYRFSVRLAPTGGPVRIDDLRLEIPFRETVAQLIEASVTWRRKLGTQPECMGELSRKQGPLWDSRTFPSRNWPRIGNMPPFIWIGDDDRGLVYSCASEEGMHNDERRPAAKLERRGHEVIYTGWFVNSPLQLRGARTFQFALQASPFKPMPANARLWRNQNYRMPYAHGTLFTNWFTDGSYPTYGRFLTLDLLGKYARATGADRVGVMASAVSECGGTPEYQQFWHEWGSELGWNRMTPAPPEDWAVRMLQEANLPGNSFVRVEAASNVCATNVAYRLWWFNEEIRKAGTSYLYQDNPPYVYYFDPPNGYGYVRDDGRNEPTSAIWNSRLFAKRVATAAVEAGKSDSPYLWVNAISPVIPGRSFARKMLNGEYLYTKLFTLGQWRVMSSKQWGMVLDWYPFPQTEESPYPNIGPVRKYWREVYSRLLLHDVTNFSGADNAEFSKQWLNALDVFWLDDPTVRWHPYYRNDTVASTARPTTYVSTYTARGRTLLVISNQGADSVVESVGLKNLDRFGAGGLRYFCDAETGEDIEVSPNGALKLFIPRMDYRVVVGFREPWAFAAGAAVGAEALPAQSTLDPELTLAAISRQLLRSPNHQPIPGANRLYEKWMKRVLADLPADSADVLYRDAASFAGVEFGKPGIQCSAFYNKRLGAMLVNYYNGSDQDVSLQGRVRDEIARRMGKPGHNYVIHPVYGYSEWEFVDIPAHRGLLEIWYSDAPDFSGPRHGPVRAGTMMGDINRAVEANQRALGGRPIK